MSWENVSAEWETETGGERWLLSLTPTSWVSVLHRLTGFGWWEWETAYIRIREDGDPLKHARGSWDDREQIIIAGDHREAISGMPVDQIPEWFRNGNHPKNTMGQVLDAMAEVYAERGERQINPSIAKAP